MQPWQRDLRFAPASCRESSSVRNSNYLASLAKPAASSGECARFFVSRKPSALYHLLIFSSSHLLSLSDI